MNFLFLSFVFHIIIYSDKALCEQRLLKGYAEGRLGTTVIEGNLDSGISKDHNVYSWVDLELLVLAPSLYAPVSVVIALSCMNSLIPS